MTIQPPGGFGPGDAPAAGAIVDATDADFVPAVIERSHELPVVVDFWAPWCGPCRNLGPVLERLAGEYAGRLALVKVDIDQSPAIAQQLKIQSIPLVVAFRDGRAVSEFQGAQPENVVRQFIDAILPSGVDVAVSEGMQALASGDVATAEARFLEALGEDPRHAGALLGSARLLAERGETDGALETLGRITIASREIEQEAERLAAEIRALGGSREADPAAEAELASLRADATAHPDDLAKGLALGKALVSARQFDEALPLLVSLVARDRAFADEAARKLLLDVFELLGASHPLTQEYRRELARALFK